MVAGRFSVALLIGPPGAGKGTQARYVGEALGIRHVASGDLLREHRQRDTPIGLTARAYMDQGDLVPDELVVQMVIERLARPDAARGVVLDGFPRTVCQARALDIALAERGGRVTAALFLDVPSVVTRRVAVYQQQTAPVLDHYRVRGVLRRADASSSVELTRARVLEQLGLRESPELCSEPTERNPGHCVSR